MWEKIVLNLLSNAFKFTFEGEICVRVRDAGERVEIEVSDTGTGIPEDELPRMFERFHRVENARGRSHEGSGIGLALVSELVKLHGGSIDVRQRLGRPDTAFIGRDSKGQRTSACGARTSARRTSVCRPLRAPAPMLQRRWVGCPRQRRRRMLPRRTRHEYSLADDNADLREYARRLLGEHYDVHTVPDGQAALEAARALRPDSSSPT